MAIFDATSGGVEIYRGKHYPEKDDRREAEQRANLLTLRFTGGDHYQALVPQRPPGPRLSELLTCLDAEGVLYVVTDG